MMTSFTQAESWNVVQNQGEKIMIDKSKWVQKSKWAGTKNGSFIIFKRNYGGKIQKFGKKRGWLLVSNHYTQGKGANRPKIISF